MGQRLNVEILNEGKPIANSYYHWSAYTPPAISITEEIIEGYNETSEISPLRIAVEILQRTGAGVPQDERARIDSDTTGRFKKIEFAEAKSRNDGLIAVTEEGMNETRAWEEGRVEIDIGNETVNFMVLYEMSNSEYEEYEGENEVIDIPSVDYDFFSPCKFSDFHKFVDIVVSNPQGVRIGENHIIGWIL